MEERKAEADAAVDADSRQVDESESLAPAVVPQSDGEKESEEATVGGVPRSLLQTVMGMSALLILLGVLCELYALWDSRQDGSSWERLLITFLAVPLLFTAGHLYWTRRRGLQMFSTPFLVFLAANTLILPALVILPSILLVPSGPFIALAYSLAFLWYGAFYESSVAVSASCALGFTSVLSIPLLYRLSMLSSGLVLVGVGCCMLYFVYRLAKIRADKLGQRDIALKRQELSRIRKQEEKVESHPSETDTPS